jgi:hypothetical protein
MKFPPLSSLLAVFAAVLLLTLSSVGCQSSSSSHVGVVNAQAAPTLEQSAELGLEPPQYFSPVRANVTPPLGWDAQPLKSSDEHAHEVWISPSRHTAYGVIRFDLPLPVGHELALKGFLGQMRQGEGEATLLSKQWDDVLRGMRFVATGGLYTIRSNLLVRGFGGWACYAGTLKNQPVDSAELELALAARDHTTYGQPLETGTTDAMGRRQSRNTPEFRQEISSR